MPDERDQMPDGLTPGEKITWALRGLRLLQPFGRSGSDQGDGANGRTAGFLRHLTLGETIAIGLALVLAALSIVAFYLWPLYIAGGLLFAAWFVALYAAYLFHFRWLRRPRFTWLCVLGTPPIAAACFYGLPHLVAVARDSSNTAAVTAAAQPSAPYGQVWYVGEIPNRNRALLLVFATITNPGAPTSFRDLSATINYNGRDVTGLADAVMTTFYIRSAGICIGYGSADDLVERIYNNAIPTGESRSGVVEVGFTDVAPGLSKETLQTLKLNFTGIDLTTHTTPTYVAPREGYPPHTPSVGSITASSKCRDK